MQFNSRFYTPIIISGILVSLVILFHKYLLFNNFFLFDDVGSDTMSLFYPSLLDEARIFREEGLPFWSFAKGMGQSNWSGDLLDPLNWILLILGEKHLAYGLGWVAILKVAASSFFSYKLFKLQGFHPYAVILGTILVTFMGYLITGTTWYGHASNIMYMLMFLYGLELMITRNSWWILVISAVLLLGPHLFFITEYAIIYCILRFGISNKLNTTSVLGFFNRLWRPALFGLLISAPFLGSTINTFINSPRIGGDASYADALSSIGVFSVNEAGHIATILSRFFSNDMLGPPNAFLGWKNYLEAPLFYCGLITFLLLPQLFPFLKRKQKIITGSILGFFTLTLVFPYLRNAFYLFQGEYYKAALSLFIPFTMIWLAVLALHHIILNKKINLPLLAGTFVGLIALLFSLGQISNLVRVDPQIQIIVAVFLVLQSLLLFLLSRSYKGWILNVILLLALIEGVVLSYPAINDRSALDIDAFKDRKFYNDYSLEVLDYIESQDPGFYRVEKLFGSYLSNGLNDSQAQGYFDTKSYRSHNHNSYIQYLEGITLLDPRDENKTRWIGGLHTAFDIHPLVNIKYLLTQGQNDLIDLSFYTNKGQLNGINIFESKYHIPFGIPYSQYILKSEVENFDYFRVVEGMYNALIIDDKEAVKFPSLNQFSAKRIGGMLKHASWNRYFNASGMKLTSFKQSRIEGTIDISQASIVYFSIPFDAGWSAYANEKKAPTTKVQFGMTGVYLEPGNYNLVLKYRPPYFTTGIILFIIGLIGMIYLVIKNREINYSPLLPTFKSYLAKQPSNGEKASSEINKDQKKYKKRKKKR